MDQVGLTRKRFKLDNFSNEVPSVVLCTFTVNINNYEGQQHLYRFGSNKLRQFCHYYNVVCGCNLPPSAVPAADVLVSPLLSSAPLHNSPATTTTTTTTVSRPLMVLPSHTGSTEYILTELMLHVSARF